MNCPFLHIQSHTRAMMIEQIMALIGRGSSNPRQYRRTLESFETATLRRTLQSLTGANGENGADFFGTNGAKTDEQLLPGEPLVPASEGRPSSPVVL